MCAQMTNQHIYGATTLDCATIGPSFDHIVGTHKQLSGNNCYASNLSRVLESLVGLWFAFDRLLGIIGRPAHVNVVCSCPVLALWESLLCGSALATVQDLGDVSLTDEDYYY